MKKGSRSLYIGMTAVVGQLMLGAGMVLAADAQTLNPADTARIAELEQKVNTLQNEITGMANRSSVNADVGVPLHGFGDVGYRHASKAVTGSTADRGFNVGTFSVYLSPQLGGNIKSLVELAFEVDSEGGLATDLERLQVGYLFGDAATVWVGRFHTPYGYWNTGFHHGAQIQTSILRPQFIDFEDKGGILPAHSIGLWSTGGYRLGAGKLNYDAYIANGNRLDVDAGGDGVLDFNAAKDDNNDKALGFNLAYDFDNRLEGLRLGIHGLRQEVAVYDTTAAVISRTMMNMLGGYAFYENNGWEGIAEYYRFNNKDLSGGTGSYTSWAGFAQLAYYTNSQWAPYLRTEKTALDQNDSYFSQQVSGRSYTRNALGLRYDLTPKAAIKLEVNHTSITDGIAANFNEVRAQYAFRF